MATHVTAESADSGQARSTGRAHAQITDERQSALRRYQDVVVGSTKFWFTIKYEIICFLDKLFPGAAGLWLRPKLYRALFRRFGRGVVLGSRLTVRHPNKIEIGDNVVVADQCTLDARGDDSARIIIGDNSIIGDRCTLRCKGGRIVIGKNVGINTGALLGAVEGNQLTIGDDSAIGPYCYLEGTQYHHDRLDVPTRLQGLNTKGGITIGANTFVGAQSTVLDGVSIGTGCVIGAATTIKEDVPDLTVVLPHERLVSIKRLPRKSEI